MRRFVMLATAVVLLAGFVGSSLAAPSGTTAFPRFKRVFLDQYGDLAFSFGGQYGSCSREENPSVVKVTMKNAKLKYTIQSDWCDAGADLGLFWSETGSTWIYDQEGKPTIHVGPNNYGTSIRTWGYWVTIDGQLVRKGQVRVKLSNGGLRVIWEDEDDFVNICINDTETIRKREGRLYCVVKAGFDYTIKLLR